MRLIDLMIYYTTTFHAKDKDGFFWSTPLKRSVFLAGLNVTFWLFSMLEVLMFFAFRKNLIEIPFSKIGFIITGILIIQLLKYIYVDKKRYDYIESHEYRKFKLNLNLGMALCFLIFVSSFISGLAIALAVNYFLTHPAWAFQKYNCEQNRNSIQQSLSFMFDRGCCNYDYCIC